MTLSADRRRLKRWTGYLTTVKKLTIIFQKRSEQVIRCFKIYGSFRIIYGNPQPDRQGMTLGTYKVFSDVPNVVQNALIR